ncbi:uncharacterized protein DS421_13g417390 [Arachis hypogaea]|nr:uncharacterized protein DS421_13g417390 [Arachis hypogaea]
MNQVVVGATIGSIISLMWYWLWNAFIQDAYQSSLFVRIIGLSGSIGICICFLVFVLASCVLLKILMCFFMLKFIIFSSRSSHHHSASLFIYVFCIPSSIGEMASMFFCIVYLTSVS